MSSGWSGGITSASPSPGGDNTVFTENFTLTPTDISNGYVSLSFNPTEDSETTVNPIGGPEQEYGIDYQVTGQTLSWQGLGLAQLLDVGDILVVAYPIIT